MNQPFTPPENALEVELPREPSFAVVELFDDGRELLLPTPDGRARMRRASNVLTIGALALGSWIIITGVAGFAGYLR